MDTLTIAERSELMKRVRGKDTNPELAVRKLVHQMGFRYRLHRDGLPGRPDLVFSARRKVIFVNGCFWHGHRCRAGRNRPSTHTAYWFPKLDRNKVRDRINRAQLKRSGWDVLIIWECQLKDKPALRSRIAAFLGNRNE
jgi:DNA mismatch endonuclease (patch repair protein)